MAAMNRFRPADALGAKRIKELEAEVVALNESLQRLAAAQQDVLELAASSAAQTGTAEDHIPR